MSTGSTWSHLVEKVRTSSKKQVRLSLAERKKRRNKKRKVSRASRKRNRGKK